MRLPGDSPFQSEVVCAARPLPTEKTAKAWCQRLNQAVRSGRSDPDL